MTRVRVIMISGHFVYIRIHAHVGTRASPRLGRGGVRRVGKMAAARPMSSVRDKRQARQLLEHLSMEEVTNIINMKCSYWSYPI